VHVKPRHINFIQAGARIESNKGGQPCSILDGSKDWELQADIGKRLQFPDIVHTTLPSQHSDVLSQGKEDCHCGADGALGKKVYPSLPAQEV